MYRYCSAVFVCVLQSLSTVTVATVDIWWWYWELCTDRVWLPPIVFPYQLPVVEVLYHDKAAAVVQRDRDFGGCTCRAFELYVVTPAAVIATPFRWWFPAFAIVLFAHQHRRCSSSSIALFPRGNILFHNSLLVISH